MLSVFGIVVSVVPSIDLPCGEYENSDLDVVVVDTIGVDAMLKRTGIVDFNIGIGAGIVHVVAVADGSEDDVAVDIAAT